MSNQTQQADQPQLDEAQKAQAFFNAPPEVTYSVEIYLVNKDKENPVANAYAIRCHTEEQSKLLFEILQRHMQLATQKPMV